MPPEKLGRYEIVREIGHGAMGVVYEATDPTIGRKIALKAIRFDGIGTTADEAARRFKNEARAAGGLNHPNIVTVYDAGEDNGNLFLAMEYIEGATLDLLLSAQRRLSPVQTTDIIRQVCAGLDFAHSRGIVHRDIKPANVMLAAHGLVKITDFGIARAGEVMTMTGQVIGTPNYMSPEQVLGKTLDGRSDLFSVGVMLYEMITGERPFEGQSITTIMYKIVHETPIPPLKLDGSIHPGLSAVIEKSLAKSPEERFQNGTDLTQALQHYQRSSGVVSTLGTPTAGVPILADANPPGDVRQPAASAQNAQPSATAGQAPLPAKPRLWVRLFADSKTRKRAIAIGIVGLIWLSSTYKRHENSRRNEAGNDNPPVASAPAAASPANPPDTADNATPDQKMALLKVDSSPPTAQIDVDGKSTGKATPADLQLAPGKHTVSVHMAGFQTATASFQLKAGEERDYSPQLAVAIPNISVPGLPDLSKLQGLSKENQAEFWQQWANGQSGDKPELVINSKPPGARIFINGKDSGHTSPAIIPVQPGTYHVLCVLDGFEPAHQDVTVGKHPKTLNPTLRQLQSQQ
jgi:eukaryotic-like serine/threonine-protein kinase